jgi:hypothetical protein
VLERLAVNAKVATVLGSIPASSDTVESVWRQIEAVFNNVRKKKKNPQKSPINKCTKSPVKITTNILQNLANF